MLIQVINKMASKISTIGTAFIIVSSLALMLEPGMTSFEIEATKAVFVLGFILMNYGIIMETLTIKENKNGN